MVEIYAVRVQASEPINRLFRLINQKINQELKLIGECHKCLGMIESLTSRSAQLPKIRLPTLNPEIENINTEIEIDAITTMDDDFEIQNIGTDETKAPEVRFYF